MSSLSWPSSLPPFSTLVLGYMTLTNIFRGSVHVFLKDSGLVRIAKVDPTIPNFSTMVTMMAITGVEQLCMGALGVLVLTREKMKFLKTLLLLVFTCSAGGYSFVWVRTAYC